MALLCLHHSMELSISMEPKEFPGKKYFTVCSCNYASYYIDIIVKSYDTYTPCVDIQHTELHPFHVQIILHLQDLMIRNRFEASSTFLHIVSAREKDEHKGHSLRKVLPLYNQIRKCLELYQPLPELSIDERMVESKARSHFCQYIPNKPTKWGFTFWVIADPTGYT